MNFLQFHFPRFEELPGIPLYLDQVIGLLNDSLAPFFEPGEDKIITGAMVNNYVKHKVIQPPQKKRYDRTHLASLYILCLLKKIFSITEISEMLQNYGASGDIETSYNRFCQEMELALTIKFSQSLITDNLQEEEGCTPLNIERAMALAVANKLLVQTLMKDARMGF